MPEFTIAGKRVVVRDDYPANEFWELPNLLLAVSGEKKSMNMRAAPALLASVVVSWEFEGDPHDADAYGCMDMLRVLIPLTTAVAKFINEVTGLGEEG